MLFASYSIYESIRGAEIAHASGAIKREEELLTRYMLVTCCALLLSSCAQVKELTSGGSSDSSSATESTADQNGNVQTVKSVDGSFEGEIIGGDPKPGSKFSKVKIGMRMAQVEKLIGDPDDSDSHITGKAFIPFFFGGDTHRVEQFYKDEGILTYSPAHFGGEPNVLVAITVDPNEQGIAH